MHTLQVIALAIGFIAFYVASWAVLALPGFLIAWLLFDASPLEAAVFGIITGALLETVDDLWFGLKKRHRKRTKEMH